MRCRAALVSAPLAVLMVLTALVVGARAQGRDPQRFTVQVDGHPLAVWARVPPTPRGALVLVHGRTWSGRPAFDLQVPGFHRSVLESLAAQGFAAYALDLRGYGDTPRDSTGWLTPERAAADAAAVLKWVAARHSTLPRPVLLGWSYGAAVAHLTAVRSPALMSSLVLVGYAPDPDTVVAPSVDPASPLKAKNTRAAAASDFISPMVTPRAVVDAFVNTAIKTDPILVDWRKTYQFVYDGSKVSVPTLVIEGERDPGVDLRTAAKFFGSLGTPDRQLVIIPDADHCAQLEDTHDAWIAAVVNFLVRPGRTHQ